MVTMAMLWTIPATATAEVSAAPAVLEPTGKWYVIPTETNCTLARMYSSERRNVTVSWRLLPLIDLYQLTVRWRDDDRAMYRGSVDVTLDPGERDLRTFEGFVTAEAGERAMQVDVTPEQFSGLPKRSVMTLRPSRGPNWSFAIDGSAPAFEALAACGKARLTEWGIDADEREKIAAVAEPATDPSTWLSPSDYATSAVASNAQGTTYILYSIGVDGRVTDCRVIGSSGDGDLDASACRAITRRGRYKPALGLDGAPTPMHLARRAKWVFPDVWTTDPSFYQASLREEIQSKERNKRVGKAIPSQPA